MAMVHMGGLFSTIQLDGNQRSMDGVDICENQGPRRSWVAFVLLLVSCHRGITAFSKYLHHSPMNVSKGNHTVVVVEISNSSS